MNILLITHRFLPRYVGGVEFYTLRLAKALQNLGHQALILTGEPAPQNDLSVQALEKIYEGVPLIRLIYDYYRRPVSHWAAYSGPLITDQIEQVLRVYHPDVIHATSLSLLMAGAIEAATRVNLPLVYTVTDFVLTCRRGIYVKRDDSLCAEKDAVELCMACMGPHTAVEKSLNGLCRRAIVFS